MVDVVLVTARDLPHGPDIESPLIVTALRDRGVEATVEPWGSAAASQGRLVVIRSTWDYTAHRDEFLEWARQVAATTRLVNSADIIAWNSHKSYLLDMAYAGVPVVPTTLVAKGASVVDQSSALEEYTGQVVIKPAVSGGSRATVRVKAGDEDRGEAHLRSLAAREDVLVQPYLASVEGHGERAIVWVDGEPMHAVRKQPRFLGDAESVSAAVAIEADEADLTRRAVAAAPGPLLYARVDVVRDAGGVPRVMELELIEPSLFFHQGPAALARYVAAVEKRLLGSPV